jgi:subtilisin family serine protease
MKSTQARRSSATRSTRVATRTSVLLTALTVVAMLAIVAPSSAATAARDAVGSGQVPAYRAGEVLVRFRAGASAADKAAVNRTVGAQILKAFTIVPNLQLVGLAAGVSVNGALAIYRAQADVQYAQPNWLLRLGPRSTPAATQAAASDPFAVAKTPNDAMYPQQWDWPKVHAPEAWDQTTGSRKVVVTDIDTGFDYKHPDLKKNAWQNTAECSGQAGVDDDSNGYVDDCWGIDTDDGDSDPAPDPTGGYREHGTHTGGTMGAVGNNKIGVTGFSWKVSVMPCKSHGGDGVATPATIIECFQYAAMEKQEYGYDVVATNNSYGGCTEACDFDPATKDGIRGLWKAGILFIAAAGNTNSDNDSVPQYPANYFLPNVVAVAATDINDNRASFSSYGHRAVAVGAPGVTILSTIPGGGYANMSGTSMATPHVTGLAGLLASAGGLDWIAIRNLLISGGDPVASLSGLTVSGRRINAFGSIQCGSGHTVKGLLSPLATASGNKIKVAVLNIDCAAPAGAPSVTINPGSLKLQLRDNGKGPDLEKADGIYSMTWKPAPGNYTIKVAGGSTYPVTVTP